MQHNFTHGYYKGVHNIAFISFQKHCLQMSKGYCNSVSFLPSLNASQRCGRVGEGDAI